MLAIGIRKFGDSSVIENLEIPEPVPGPGQIMVFVKAAGVGPRDLMTCQGAFGQTQFPVILGFEAAGVVEAIGEGVKDFKIGDYVLGVNYKTGCFGQYVIFEASQATHKMPNMDWNAAASLPVCGSTALNCLAGELKISVEHTLLITGAAGGVGSLAVQIAKSSDLRVIGVAKAKDLPYLKTLGVKALVDTDKAGWEKDVQIAFPKGVDRVLDTVGGETMKRCFDVLKDDGKLVTTVPLKNSDPAPRGIQVKFYQGMPSQNILRDLIRRATYGNLKLRLDDRFPLYRAQSALQRIEQHQAKGKIVLLTEMQTHIYMPPKKRA